MDDKDLPKVEKISGRMVKTCGVGTMVIPAPREVDAGKRMMKVAE